MLKTTLLTILISLSAMACNICKEIESTQIDVQHAYNMYKSAKTEAGRKEWFDTYMKAKRSLALAKKLPVSHGHD